MGSSRWLLKLHLHLSISTAMMRPRRPKQYCLQLYIYIYIYTRLQKHCYFRNIYHIYVQLSKRDLSKVDTYHQLYHCGHYLQSFTSMSFLMLTKKIQAQKRHNYIYDICFYKSNVFVNGCIYIYIYYIGDLMRVNFTIAYIQCSLSNLCSAKLTG